MLSCSAYTLTRSGQYSLRLLLKAIFPLHDKKAIDNFYKDFTFPLWDADDASRFPRLPWMLDYSSIRNYLGEQIAIYFLFAQHYTFSLFCLALVSVFFELILLFFALSSTTITTVYAVLIALYSSACVIWGGITLSLWKVEEEMYAFKWGTSGFIESEVIQTFSTNSVLNLS